MSHVTDAARGGPSRPAAGSGRRRLALIVVAVVAVIALVLTGGALAFAKQFEGKALPGTTVLGTDVSGQTAGQIAAAVADRAEGVTVTVTADGQEQQVPLTELGVEVDAAATAQDTVEHDGSLREVISTIWSGTREVAPVVTVDEAAIADFAAGLIPDDRTSPVNAEVVQEGDELSWTVVPGTDGRGVDPAALVETVTEKASALEDFTVRQHVERIAPAITTEDAQATVEEIDAVLEQPMAITGAEGESHQISSERRAGWLSVEPNEAGDALQITVDEDSVRDWVSARADDDAVAAKDGIEQIGESGEVVQVLAEKQDGVEITNVDTVTEQVLAALGGSGPLEAAFETETIEAEVTQADAPSAEESTDEAAAAAADTAESEPAEPAGEKWIDVDLTAKTVTAYVGETPVWGPRAMVDGKEGWETATGSYEIYLRNAEQDLTNASRYDEDHPDYYYTPDVPYVQYFHGGYAFHGAPWRSSFGYSGSHGCINLPLSDAKWLWDWAETGTRVEVHR